MTRFGRVLNNLARFGLVGSAGFLVDAIVLATAIAAGAGPFWGRALSIVLAGLTTWRLNRRYTFESRPDTEMREGARYAVALLSGSALNYAIYAGLAVSGMSPLLALFISSAAVMMFSYIVYRHVVFAGPKAV